MSKISFKMSLVLGLILLVSVIGVIAQMNESENLTDIVNDSGDVQSEVPLAEPEDVLVSESEVVNDSDLASGDSQLVSSPSDEDKVFSNVAKIRYCVDEKYVETVPVMGKCIIWKL